MKADFIEEYWEDDDKLPDGWKISRNLGNNIFVLLSREGILYQTLDTAQEFIAENDEYDDTDALNIEELCFQLVETYVSEMNVKLNESQVERKNAATVDIYIALLLLVYLHTGIYVHTCILSYLHACILAYFHICPYYLHTWS